MIWEINKLMNGSTCMGLAGEAALPNGEKNDENDGGNQGWTKLEIETPETKLEKFETSN